MSQLDQRDACHTLEKSKEKVDLDRLSHHHCTMKTEPRSSLLCRLSFLAVSSVLF